MHCRSVRRREDTVRLWRSDFARAGVEALETSPVSGPAPVKAEAALRVAAPSPRRLSPTSGTGRCAPHRRDRGARGGVTISKSRPSRCCGKKIPLASAAPHPEGPPGRRRHRPGRPQAALRKAQAEAGDIVLLFADESAPIRTRFGNRRHGVRPNDFQVSKTGLRADCARPRISG